MKAKGKFGDTVSVHFTCKLEDGTVVDNSEGRDPLQIQIGKSGYLQDFEKAFIGLEPGEKKSFTVTSEKAYGLYKEELRQVLSRAEFPGDVQPEVGMEIKVKQDNDKKVIRVVEVTESSVTLDANHHLAGKDLFFDITLVDIIKPGPSASVYITLGNALQEKGLMEEAIQHYLNAIETDPSLTEAYFKMGALYQIMGHYDDAMNNYQRVLDLKADHLEAILNLGNVLRIKGEVDKAISMFNKAITINPDYASTYNNLGVAFKDKGDLNNAILHYKKALELDDGLAEVHNNLGMAFQDKGQFDDAEKSFRKALQLNGNLAEAHFNLSSALLLSGRLKEGWEEYEWRLKFSEFGYPSNQTLWDGEDIKEKTLLLCAEQGFEDTIQFIRYAPLIADRKIQVLVACQKELESLLWQIKGVNRVIPFGQSLPPFDFQCHLLSLPRIFDTTLSNIPSNVPYISVRPSALRQWKDKIEDKESKLRIGIAWAGDPSHRKNHLRSLVLSDFLPLLQRKDIGFYKLQKDTYEEQKLTLNGELPIIDYSYLITDFSDTAAFIENLDLIISVDTSVAHLAGALGKTVWTLLPYVPDWRWMLDREDSPWYPTMRLFRQPSPGDWGSVIKRVAEEIKKTYY